MWQCAMPLIKDMIKLMRVKINTNFFYVYSRIVTLSFIISVTILTFLAFYHVKIIVSSRGFSPCFLSIGIKF